MARPTDPEVGPGATDDAPRIGAALSYYTTFSIAPVLVIALAVAGACSRPSSARSRSCSERPRCSWPCPWRSSPGCSRYGAAGSFAVMLVWIYYSAQLVLFGAEFTHVYAHRRGSHAGEPGSGAGDSAGP